VKSPQQAAAPEPLATLTVEANNQSDQSKLAPHSALKFVVLMGCISLLADMTYEGARSITGPYLALLGASAFAVGIVAGAGELVGYTLRLLSGYVTDRTENYWGMAFLGYATNLIAVPLLALAGRWEVAALLIIMERTGKALRAPARDAMLSHATKSMGRGKGFGLHKAMDQTGALLGPIIITTVLYFKGTSNEQATPLIGTHHSLMQGTHPAQLAGYQLGFAVLAIPALLALCVLLVARFLYPHPQHLEVKRIELESKGFSKAYWTYLAAVALIAAGYADFPLIAYHFKKVALAPDNWIPLFYSLAMGVEAVTALICGRLFDRNGFSVLLIAALFSALFAPLIFLGNLPLAFAGIILWGLGTGAQESVMKAAVADMVPANRRGSAYGVFNTGYGVCWFLGSALIGFLYDHSILALVIFSVVIQLASIPLFMKVQRNPLGRTSN